MQHRRLGALVGATLLASASPLFGQVDKQTSGTQTIYRVGPEASSSFQVSASFACPGEENCRPAVVQVNFTQVISLKQIGGAKYDEEHSVSMVLNDETQLSVPNPRYLQRKGTGGWIYEVIVCLMPVDDYLLLSRAQKAEYQIGPTSGELTEEQRDVLADLAQEIQEAEGT